MAYQLGVITWLPWSHVYLLASTTSVLVLCIMSAIFHNTLLIIHGKIEYELSEEQK